MFPFLIHRGNLIITTFSFMLMMASLTATFYAYGRAPKKGLSQVVILDLGIIGTLAAIVGGRLFHVFVEAWPYYRAHPDMIYKIWNGGFVSYGAFILMGVSWFLYLKLRKLPVLKYLDYVALSAPIVIFFVRVGCLGAGCCYGKPTHFFLHLVFTHRSSDAGLKFAGVPLHATQVYSMINAVFLFLMVHLIDRKKKFEGQVAWSFLMLYGFTRGMIEFLRGDIDRGLYFGGALSTAQVMGILAILIGAILYFYSRHRANIKGMNPRASPGP